MAKTQKGIRIHEEQWEKASEICGKMNTNLSAVINQLIAQIIIQERIPFSLYLNKQESGCLLSEGVVTENEDIQVIEQAESDFTQMDVPDIGTVAESVLSDDDMDIEQEDSGMADDDSQLDWSALDIFGRSGK